MKKIALLTMALVSALTLAACGNSEPPPATESGSLPITAAPATAPVSADAEPAAAPPATPTRESIMQRQQALQKFREAQKRALEHSKASK